MSANSSTADQSSQPLDMESFLWYCGYSVVGAISFITNALLVFILLKSPNLRERTDVQIYSILSLSDAILALGVFLLGVRRIYLLLHGPLTLVNAWYCMTTLGETPTVFGELLAPLMYLSLSGDRLHNVCSGARYSERPPGNNCTSPAQLLHIGLPLASTMFTIGVGWYLSSTLPNTPVFTVLCFTDYAFPEAYMLTLYTVEALAGSLSCLLYTLTLSVLWVKTQKHIPMIMANNYLQPAENRSRRNFKTFEDRKRLRQVKVTKTLTLIMLITFLCSVVPSVLKAFSNVVNINSPLFAIVTPYLGLLNLANSILSASLYWAKQADVRRETAALMTACCRKQWINNR